MDADDEEKKPKSTDSSQVNLIPSDDDTQKSHDEKKEDAEQLQSLASPSPSPKSKVQKTIKKLLHLPRLKVFKKKGRNIEQSDESDVKQAFFVSTPSKSLEGSKKHKKKEEGNRIRYLKQKLFGEGTGWSKKPDDSSDSEEISILTVTSKESKSSKLIENWVKTGTYHGSECAMALKEPLQSGTKTLSLPASETKRSTGYNIFKRFFGRKDDTVSATTGKHSTSTKSGKKEDTQPRGSIWKFWKKKEAVSYHLIPQTLTEAGGSKLVGVNSTDGSKLLGVDRSGSSRPSQQQIALVSLEDEPFMSMKRVQTPAKIVHERFKIDEV